MTSNFPSATLGKQQEPPISIENYSFLQDQVYRESGIVLDETKHYLIEARLAPLLEKERLTSLNDLCALLRATSGAVLRQQVIEAMTTNETLFFRDSLAFDALRNTIIPKLIERHKSDRTLNFWSAAASSGQEAYSLAILLLEMGLQDWKIRILGTDLNQKVLDRARAGRFLQMEVNRGMPDSYLTKYFRRSGNEWQISDAARKMTEFTPFDLRQSMRSLGPFDLIMCRNVLIYFDFETKKKILSELKQQLVSGGLLLLGCAESLLNLETGLEKKVFDRAIYYQAP